jgi:hypothetical protein
VFIFSSGNCQPKLPKLIEDMADLALPFVEILVVLKMGNNLIRAILPLDIAK